MALEYATRKLLIYLFHSNKGTANYFASPSFSAIQTYQRFLFNRLTGHYICHRHRLGQVKRNQPVKPVKISFLHYPKTTARSGDI